MSEYHRRHRSVLYPGSADALALGEEPDQCAHQIDRSAHSDELDPYHLGHQGTWFENPELARQLKMGNQAAVEHLEKLRKWEHGDDKPQPFPDKLGTPDWYDARHMDHLRRHGNDPPPPAYYLEYGKKYCIRFSEELFPKLSKAGQAWVVATRMHLQLMLEKMVLDDPEGYAELELDAQKFKDYAFGTHREAYLKGGLLDLPTQDLKKIVLTPDMKDIASTSGLDQIFKTAPSVGYDRMGDLFAEPGILPSRQHLRNWSGGDPEAEDVPYQTAPELPVDAQSQVLP